MFSLRKCYSILNKIGKFVHNLNEFLRRKVIIALLSLVAFTGAGISAVYVFENVKVCREEKYERKKAYRGSSTMRKDAGKRAGQAVDAWKDQFKK